MHGTIVFVLFGFMVLLSLTSLDFRLRFRTTVVEFIPQEHWSVWKIELAVLLVPIQTRLF